MTIAISFVLPIQPKSKKHINWSAYSANIKKYISMMTNARKITVGLLQQLIFYYTLAKNERMRHFTLFMTLPTPSPESNTSIFSIPANETKLLEINKYGKYYYWVANKKLLV